MYQTPSKWIQTLLLNSIGRQTYCANGKEGKDKVCLSNFTQSQVQEVERKNVTPEKLAADVILFTPHELASGNCTKPIRNEMELDNNRLWAIKCKCPHYLHTSRPPMKLYVVLPVDK